MPEHFRRYTVNDNLYFDVILAENQDIVGAIGDVWITDKHPLRTFNYHIPSGVWCSVVLTLSAFNERPNDWQAFRDHHLGRCDMLNAAKSLNYINNALATIMRNLATVKGVVPEQGATSAKP